MCLQYTVFKGGILGEMDKDEVFGGKGTGWENAGEVGALQVERKSYFGYHRSFIQLADSGGKREWKYVTRGEDGNWIPATAPSNGVGEVTERDGKLWGIEYQLDERGISMPREIELPRLTD